MKICFGCFEQYDDSFDICPHCGYAEGTEPELATYMRPGAILNERYVIGRALGHGGFSVTYLAWDALLLHAGKAPIQHPNLPGCAPGNGEITAAWASGQGPGIDPCGKAQGGRAGGAIINAQAVRIRG